MARQLTAASSQAIQRSGFAAPVGAFNVTMGMWVKIPSLPAGNTVLFSIEQAGGFNYLCLILTPSGTIVANVNANGPNTAATSSNTISLNAWHYIAGVFTASQFAVYLDGVKTTGASTGAYPAGLNTITVGAMAAAPGPLYSTATVAEAAVWNVALSSNQITALTGGAPANQVQPVGGPFTGQLVMYWPLWGVATLEPGLCNNSINSINGAVLGGAPAANHAPVSRYSPFPQPYLRAASFLPSPTGIYVPQRTLRGTGI